MSEHLRSAADVGDVRILIVEDDLDMRETLTILLAAEGYRVVGAANGQQALDKLRSSELPDLILLDWTMPVMDGGDFRRAQLGDAIIAFVPVIVLTATGEPLLPEFRIDACLRKPIEFKSLLDAIHRQLPAVTKESRRSSGTVERVPAPKVSRG